MAKCSPPKRNKNISSKKVRPGNSHILSFPLVSRRFSYCFLRFPSPNLKNVEPLVNFYSFLIVLLRCIQVANRFDERSDVQIKHTKFLSFRGLKLGELTPAFSHIFYFHILFVGRRKASAGSSRGSQIVLERCGRYRSSFGGSCLVSCRSGLGCGGRKKLT